MKHLSYIIYLLAIVSIVLTVNSCQKDEIEQNESINQSMPVAKEYPQLEKQILEFKKNAEFIKNNPEVKTEYPDMTIDDAVFILGASLNYSYTDSRELYDETIVDEETIEIDLTQNGDIEYNDVVSVFYDIFDIIADQYYDEPNPEKNIIAVLLKVADYNTLLC